MSVTVYVHKRDQELEVLDSIHNLDNLDPDSSYWIDIESKDQELLSELATKFKLHELTIEDCLTESHSPKLDNYGKYLFMIFRSLKNTSLIEEAREKEWEGSQEEKHTRGLAIYLAQNFVITHRQEEIPWLDAALRQIKQHPKEVMSNSDILAHRIIDILTDRFLRDLGYFENVIDQAEEDALSKPDEFKIASILELKRDLSTLRQIMRDQRAVINRLAVDQTFIQEKQQRRYFKDIDDHALAIIKTIDKQIETLSGVRDVFFAMSNVRLGDIMRILAVITTIAVPLNLVVGFYGMNFQVIPLLHDPNGFWLILLGMLLVALVMLLFFKKNRWI